MKGSDELLFCDMTFMASECLCPFLGGTCRAKNGISVQRAWHLVSSTRLTGLGRGGFVNLVRTLDEEAEINGDVLPTNQRFGRVRLLGRRVGSLGRETEGTLIKGTATRELGNTISEFMSITNSTFMKVAHAHVPKGTLLVSRESIYVESFRHD